jgi:hypothetical protein
MEVDGILSGWWRIENFIEESKDRSDLALLGHQELSVLIKGANVLPSSLSVCMAMKNLSMHHLP